MSHVRSYNAKIRTLNAIQVKIYTLDISYMFRHLKTVRCAIKKGNSIPVQAYYRPEAFQVVETQICRQSAREGCKVVSPTHRPPLPRRKYSWYSFLLDAEVNSEPQCGRKDDVIVYVFLFVYVFSSLSM